MIAAVRERSLADPRILAGLMYGSFARREGDEFSDVVDLSAGAYDRFRRCTAGLDRAALEAALLESWAWANDLVASLEAQYGLQLRDPAWPHVHAAIRNWFVLPPGQST